MTYERINFVDQSVERPRTYEMTHNADGSVTLVDSFGLVNELGTPINADIMNHIEDGIAENDNRITNLEDRQIVDYRIQNMLTTGSVSTDEQGYNQLDNMYHSTFDLSKFEVVGSPVITSDGVVSGFSVDDYIRPIETFDFSQNWKIKFDIETGDVIDAQTILRIGNTAPINYVVITARGTISLRLQGLSGWSSLDTDAAKQLKPNSSYTVFVEKNNNVYSIGYIDTNNSVVKNTITNENSLSKSIVDFGAGSGWFFKGSIKLATVSVTIEAIPVFNGNKTGIDTVKINDTNLEIHYTLSKTGSKIVDVAYRDRVQSVYEQYGQAEYYTIDEKNQNFTLPMGEIYGMISNLQEVKANVDLTNTLPSQTFKDDVISWGLPELTSTTPFAANPITWNTAFKLPCDAMLVFGAIGQGTPAFIQYSLNGSDFLNIWQASGTGQYATGTIILPKDIYVKGTGGSTTQTLAYVPLKGVNL